MRAAILIILAMLAGCTDDHQPRAPRAKMQERVIAAKKIVDKGPTSTTHTVSGHELVEIEIPFDAGRGYVEVQKCYVWRDKEFNTSSMQCPSEAMVMGDVEHAEADRNQP